MTPYTEHRRAMNRMVLEEARKHSTSRCPVCGKRQYKVIETRPISFKGMDKTSVVAADAVITVATETRPTKSRLSCIARCRRTGRS